MEQRRIYFTTRDLLMMAALAALGGVVSTYVNAIGDLFQSVLGFAGTTQWAAGLHVLWLTLAVGLTRKQGAGTITGLLKGGVELLTGNTHGLLVVLVDIVAGLLVDLGFLPFRKKDSQIEKICFELNGLDEDAMYEIEDADSKEKFSRTGHELMETGLPVKISQKRDSRLFFYQKQ